MTIMIENLYDIIEFVPTSPVSLPEEPVKFLGVVNTDGIVMYSSEEWKDVLAVKRDWYYKAEILSRSFMLSGADNYVSNPSVDYDVHKIIFIGKERHGEDGPQWDVVHNETLYATPAPLSKFHPDSLSLSFVTIFICGMCLLGEKASFDCFRYKNHLSYYAL